MQLGSLPQFLSAESVTTAATQMRRQVAQVRRRAAWCGIVRHGAECDILQKCQGFLRRCVALQICGTCCGVKVGIHGLLNWTAENLYLGLPVT
jgi:hypothetical protein